MSAHLNPPTIQQSLIVGPAVLARIVIGADGEPSSIPRSEPKAHRLI